MIAQATSLTGPVLLLAASNRFGLTIALLQDQADGIKLEFFCTLFYCHVFTSVRSSSLNWIDQFY